MSDEELDPEDLEEGDLDEDLDDEELDEDLDEELDADLEDEDAISEDEDEDDDEEDGDDVPRAQARPGSDDDEDDDVNPDDIEADLDSILKDKIASSDDEDDDEEEEEPGAPKEASDKVSAKSADEFTCNTCFLIVHPRQFGRAGNLTCPEGYDPCPSIRTVEKMLGKARK